ncbi:MAG: XRE family transcriptional regulator [Bacteroidales bacterium]|nr:XRE family transcriptional regulator [Bacteroidales bacterium]
MASLSQDQLVEKMGHIVSKNAISKYERGLMLPNSKILLALSKALNVKSDYFFRSNMISIDKMEFRKKRKLGIKQIDSIKENVIEFIERYLELEQHLGINSEFQNPLCEIEIQHPEDIEQSASTLLNKWNLGINALPNVIDLLEDNEIKVVEINARNEFDGLSGYASKKYPVIVLNKNFSVERKRLTALHELGHLLLSFHESFDEKEKEKMCFRFAGALLLPQKTLKAELGVKRSNISKQELILLKEQYGISGQALMARARDLGIISDQTYRRFFVIISRNRQEKGLGYYQGKEEPVRFRQLLAHATSEGIISMNKAANIANKKLAEFREEINAVSIPGRFTD